MTEYPAGVYAHLEWVLSRSVHPDTDPDRELWKEYCLKEGLTEYVDAGPRIEFYHDPGMYYRVTAKGQIALRARKPLETDQVVKPENVPAEYREQRKMDGEILSPKYLIKSKEWPFKNKTEFTRAYAKGKLTRRIKVEREFAYLYEELAALWRDDSLKDE